MRLWFRWRWNALRYWLGLTQISPSGHEFIRMVRELKYKEVK